MIGLYKLVAGHGFRKGSNYRKNDKNQIILQAKMTIVYLEHVPLLPTSGIPRKTIAANPSFMQKVLL
jgi:hypothetical protein